MVVAALAAAEVLVDPLRAKPLNRSVVAVSASTGTPILPASSVSVPALTTTPDSSHLRGSGWRALTPANR